MPQIPRLIAVTETTWEKATQLTRHLGPFVFNSDWLKMGTATHDTREQDDVVKTNLNTGQTSSVPHIKLTVAARSVIIADHFLPIKPIQNFNGLIATSNQFKIITNFLIK